MPTDPNDLESAAVRTAISLVEEQQLKLLAIESTIAGQVSVDISTLEAELFTNLLDDRDACKQATMDMRNAVNAVVTALANELAGTPGVPSLASAFATMAQLAEGESTGP